MGLCRLIEKQDEYSENYILRAITIGQTTLVAIARDKMGRKFTSAPRQIEVRKLSHPKFILRLLYKFINFINFQWLGLCTFTAEGAGSIPGPGTKIPQAVRHVQKKKKVEKKGNCKHNLNDHFYYSEWICNNLFKHSHLSNL